MRTNVSTEPAVGPRVPLHDLERRRVVTKCFPPYLPPLTLTATQEAAAASLSMGKKETEFRRTQPGSPHSPKGCSQDSKPLLSSSPEFWPGSKLPGGTEHSGAISPHGRGARAEWQKPHYCASLMSSRGAEGSISHLLSGLGSPCFGLSLQTLLPR